MKRFWLLVVLFCVCAGAWANPTLALLPVIDLINVPPQTLVREMILQSLGQTQRFSLVIPANRNLQRTLEQDPHALYLQSPASLSKIGRQAGADVIAKVQLIHTSTAGWKQIKDAKASIDISIDPLFDAAADLTLSLLDIHFPNRVWLYTSSFALYLTLIDAHNGNIITDLAIHHEKDHNLPEDPHWWPLSATLEEMQHEITNVYPRRGTVVAIPGNDQYVVNLGRGLGLGRGDKLMLFSQAPDRRDPVSGKLAAGEKILLGVGQIGQIDEDVLLLTAPHLSGPVSVGHTIVQTIPEYDGPAPAWLAPLFAEP